MATLSAAARQKLLEYRKTLGGGLIVSMKTWQSGLIRFLPLKDPDNVPYPGVAKTNVYSPSLKKGTTSPKTFGLPCPITDALTEAKGKASKEVKESLRNIANISSDQMCGVILRSEQQTVASPNIRVLPCKRTPYGQLVDLMSNPDIGIDVTHADEGKDAYLQASGSGMDREYTILSWQDAGPLHEDPEVQQAILDAWVAFDLDEWVQNAECDWAVLTEVYKALTGKLAIPAKYDASKKYAMGQKAGKTGVAKPSPKVVPVEDPADESVVVDEGDAGAEAGIDTGEGGDAGEAPVFMVGETMVSFENGNGDTVMGIISGEKVDDDNDQIYVVTDGDGTEWDVYTASLTVVEETPEPDPEPVAPTVPTPKPTPKPTPTPKPAPKPTSKPAAATPTAARPVAKPTAPKPATVKPPATKPAAVKPPVKPAPASAAIRQRLAAMKK